MFDSHHNKETQLASLLNKELRHIDASKLTRLSSIIDKSKAWNKLLEELTRSNHRFACESKLDIPLDAISLIEQQFYCGKSPTLALLNHWAITGRRRPTVKILLNYLHICNLKWAEDYVCQSILGIESIEQIIAAKPQSSKPQPPLAYDIDKEFEFCELEQLIDSLQLDIPKYSFKSIYESTNCFCHQPYDAQTGSGTKIGEGTFSAVFKATSFVEGHDEISKAKVVAAKLLKSECQLANEISNLKLLAKVQHQHIVELLGISLGIGAGDNFRYVCLIFPYMQNGSLLNCLSRGLSTRNLNSLIWHERQDIAVKVAGAICYLHSFQKDPIVHRDIKTANILVDINLEPKVGDFTLVRQVDSSGVVKTENVIGTCAYMPPEAFNGDISTKFDTFSFGIVLLELLTGLKPFDMDLGGDILSQIDNKLSDIDDDVTKKLHTVEVSRSTLEDEARDKFLREILDEKAGEWDFEKAKILFNIALEATQYNKKLRPELISILPLIEKILPCNN